MYGYNESYKEKFPEVTREQYAEAAKRKIIAPQYVREKLYNQRMISMLEAGTDLRAASKQAVTAAKAETVASQIKQQVKMSAISKASGSQFGAQALAAGMTGAGKLVSTSGLSSGGAPASTGASLITPEIVKSVSAPKITPKAKVAVAASETAADTAVEKIEKEIETQQALAPIRQRRRKQAQAQASLLRRGTGRGALLSSPAGGAGFFGGYFKG